MRTPNRENEYRTNHPDWVLLAEYALIEMMPEIAQGEAIPAGSWPGPFLELGVPAELMGEIEASLSEITRKTGFPIPPGRSEGGGSCRIFCQKKVIDTAAAPRTSRPEPGGPGAKAVPNHDPCAAVLSRGWGYFIVDRSGGAAGSAESQPLQVDLYLYQEGE